MLDNPNHQRALVKLGIIAGLAVSLMYPARVFLPLPDVIKISFFIYFGPLMVVAFIGLYPFLKKGSESVAVVFATVFGVISGTVHMMFAVVQMNAIHYIYKFIERAETDALKETWRNILRGVFTVQNGLNYVMDFFLDWTIFMFAIVLWNHPKFGKPFSILGLIAGGSHFVMKAVTFPEPPKEAGLFDAGPLVGIFFAIVVIQVIRHYRWLQRPVA